MSAANLLSPSSDDLSTRLAVDGLAALGQVVWHSSEDAGGPDVGISVGLGSGKHLWLGEISNSRHAEAGDSVAALGVSSGWWLILYDDHAPRGEQSAVLGKLSDNADYSAFADILAASMRSVPAPSPARVLAVTEADLRAESVRLDKGSAMTTIDRAGLADELEKREPRFISFSLMRGTETREYLITEDERHEIVAALRQPDQKGEAADEIARLNEREQNLRQRLDKIAGCAATIAREVRMGALPVEPQPAPEAGKLPSEEDFSRAICRAAGWDPDGNDGDCRPANESSAGWRNWFNWRSEGRAALALLPPSKPLFGPHAYLIMPRGLREDDWRLDDYPADEGAAASVPLFAKVDPFALLSPAQPHDVDGEPKGGDDHETHQRDGRERASAHEVAPGRKCEPSGGDVDVGEDGDGLVARLRKRVRDFDAAIMAIDLGTPSYADRELDVAAADALEAQGRRIAELEEERDQFRADSYGEAEVNRPLVEALKHADGFITNGIELGFIRMPDADTPDPAHDTPGIVRDALSLARAARSTSGRA